MKSVYIIQNGIGLQSTAADLVAVDKLPDAINRMRPSVGDPIIKQTRSDVATW